jgi:hypothetical protein
MTTDVLSTTDVQTGLRHVVRAVAGAVPGRPMVSAVVGRNRCVTAATSSEVLGSLFDTTLGQDGPSREAMTTGTPRHARDIRAERRWGGYPQLAAGHGIASLYCHPLRTDGGLVGGPVGGLVGALSVYSPRHDAFSPEDRDMVSLWARHTGTLLGTLVRDHAHSRLAEQLQDALDSGSTMNQALGVIMARQGCDSEAAHRVLRTTSQQQGVPQAVLARRIVEQASGGHAGPGPFDPPGPGRVPPD